MNNIQVQPSSPSRIASPLHTIIVLAAQAVLAYRGMTSANQLRSAVAPDRIHLYARTLLTEWLLFAVVALGVWLNGSSLLTILGDRWRSIGQLLRDIGIAAAFWIASTLVLSLVGSGIHGKAHDPSVGFLLPHGAFEMALWTALSISAGICEEAVYRGYLQRQFIAFTGNAPAGVLLSAIAFGGSHAYKGVWGAAQICVDGVMLGSLAYWRKTVRPGMISHAWTDFFAGVVARLLKIPVG